MAREEMHADSVSPSIYVLALSLSAADRGRLCVTLYLVFSERAGVFVRVEAALPVASYVVSLRVVKKAFPCRNGATWR